MIEAMQSSSVQTSVRLARTRHQKWKRIAAEIGVSPNEAFGLLIDAAEVVKPVLPVKAVVKANGAALVEEIGAAL